jgi:nickel-dependent lactate racemase
VRVRLAYGTDGLDVEFPDGRTSVIEPRYLPGLPDEEGALRNAVRNPVGNRPLRQLVTKDQTVAISVCDVTRPAPTKLMLPALLRELDHVPPEHITVLIATGTHRANTPSEFIEMLGRDVVDRYEVVNHDAFEDSTLASAGETSDGVPIMLNRRWLDADIRITAGFVEPHFFAGFSGGPKMVAPGLAGFATTMHLHNAARIGSHLAAWGIIEGNPVHDAVREIAALTGVHFALDVTINRDREITAAYAGDLFKVHAAACQASRQTVMQPVERPFEVVVTTNSGYPLDQNLYQAVKGMSAAGQIVADGGTIICAAECRDGVPEHGEYGRILREGKSPADLLRAIEAAPETTHDQWQVQIQAKLQMRAEVLLKSSYLTPDQVRAAHLEPVVDVAQAVDEALRNHGPDARVCVLPEGPQTVPYLMAAKPERGI